MEDKDKVDELQRLLARLDAERPKTFEEFEQEEDRAEIACARCGYWPCVCGDPEFEQWVSQDLNRAAEVD